MFDVTGLRVLHGDQLYPTVSEYVRIPDPGSCSRSALQASPPDSNVPRCGNFSLRSLDQSSVSEERLDSDVEVVGFDHYFIVESGKRKQLQCILGAVR